MRETENYLLKCATTRWKELLRQGRLSIPSVAKLTEKELYTPQYQHASRLGRGLSWSEIFSGNPLSIHTPFANNYLQAAEKLPSSIKPQSLLGVGGESLAIKIRDGNVLKMTLSGKPVAQPRAFDAPLINPGGVIPTDGNVPVQWHVQPKLDILKRPSPLNDPSTVRRLDSASPQEQLAFLRTGQVPGPLKLKGDELTAQRMIRQHARGALKPTDVYPQDMRAGGAPILNAAPKVEQFGRMADGRVVLADPNAISPYGTNREAYLAGAFTGPQTMDARPQMRSTRGPLSELLGSTPVAGPATPPESPAVTQRAPVQPPPQPAKGWRGFLKRFV